MDELLRGGHEGITADADDLIDTIRRIFGIPYSGLAGPFEVVDVKGLKKLDKIQAGIVDASSVLVTQAQRAGVQISLRQVDPDTFFGNNYLSWPSAVDWWTP